MSDPSAPTPTGHQRTTGGNFRWEPPTPAELQALMPGYTIEKLLGRGGMGAVYKGVQMNLDRTVAIKVLPPGVEKEDPSFAERFKSEAKLMAKLNHPAVVAVYDFGTTLGGQLYFAMEYVDGSDVSQMIRAQGKLPPEHALAITAHVCDALAAAHELGIVHRDIKPANVLLNMKGQVKVADFGLAKVEEPGQHGLTKTGYAMGTPDFVAPEVLMLGSGIDGRADLYAVGVMLYQMLTGEVPRGAFKPATVRVPSLDRRYDPIIIKAMQSDREERYQSSAELRRDLDVILTVPLVKQDDPASAAIPVSQVAQMPAQRSAAQKPVGRPPQAPDGRRVRQNAESAPANTPNRTLASAPTAKSKTPLFIGLGIAAALAVGAFVMFSGGKKPASSVVQASGLPVKAAGTAATPSTAPTKAAEPPKSESKPIVTKPAPAVATATTPKPVPEKNVDPKPIATTTPSPLPATKPNVSQPAAVDDIPPPVPEHWVDATALVRATAGPTQAEDVPGGWRATTLIPVITVSTAKTRNTALRVRYRAGIISMSLRTTTSLGQYSASINSIGLTSLNFSDFITLGATKLVQGTQLAGFKQDDSHELVFAAQGDDLGLWVDGQLVARGTDSRLTEGQTRLRIENGIIEKVEYAELPDDRIIAAKQQEQAKKAAVIAATASIPELATLDEQFKKLTAERVTAPFAAEVAKLNSGYLGGLDRKMAEEKAAGHLDSVLAIEAEKQAVERVSNSFSSSTNELEARSTMPIPSAEDDATSTTTPAVLKGLRQIYRDAYAKLEATRAVNMKALTDPLTTRLKLLESDLTKKDRIADAKTVKEYREGLGGRADGPPSAVVAAPQTALGGPSALSMSALKDGFTNSLGMKFLPVPGTDVLFCIHETRYSDYAAYAAETPGVDGGWKNQTCDDYALTENKEQHPVNRVSWEDAQKFCIWLSQKEGKTYRLPTDEEWSIAVGLGRAEKRPKGTTPAMLDQMEKTEFPWGGDFPPKTKDKAGNYSDESRKAKAPNGAAQYLDGYDDGFPTTAPVMSFKPNKLGLYDLGGNVWEWCEDWFDNTQKERVLRGASFYNPTRSFLLSSFRDHSTSGRRNDARFGFRVVVETRSPPPPTTKPATPTLPPPAVPPPTPATAAKSDFTNSLGMKFVPVPGTGILMCIHETRIGDFAKYAAENAVKSDRWRTPARNGVPLEVTDDHPVSGIFHEEMAGFCAWLTKKEGRVHRLPTDREWSFAAGISREEKAGAEPADLNGKVPGEYPWGPRFPPSKDTENLADESAKKRWPDMPVIPGYADGHAGPAPVMSFKPNRLGLYDLGGNVSEVCSDWMNAKHTSHVVRGSSYGQQHAPNLLSSWRGSMLVTSWAGPENGFRIVVEMTTP